MNAQRLIWVGLMIAAVAGCTPLKPYRTDYSPCVSVHPDSDCRDHALQEYRPDSPGKPGYLLGFIEFDDQGQLFDRAQLSAVLDGIYQVAAREDQDFLTVVFVHGWKHSAAPGDSNIETFRAALMHLSETEYALSAATGSKPRTVIGVYLGWRGGSTTLPVVKELTFWARKNTAHKVGHGEVTEVLNRLDLVRQTKDSLAPDGHSKSRLVVVGHSFGGAVVYSALAQILESRFVNTVGPVGATTDAQGFGNLVVLINPAFEAELFSPLSDMSAERGTYFKTQLPVLAVLTSEADDATKIAFPAGRRFSTLFEKERDIPRNNPVTHTTETISEHQANVTAVGHFAPYRTHELRAADANAASAEPEAQTVLKVSQSWENDVPGSEIRFPGSTLKRSDNSAGRNPYLVIRVDKKLIRDHNDISDPRIVQFLTHLILVSSQSGDPTERSMQRSKGLAK